MIRKARCLLCGVDLRPIGKGDFQAHPAMDDCLVQFTDAWGVDVTQEFIDEWEAAAIKAAEAPKPEPFKIDMGDGAVEVAAIFPFVEDCLTKIYEEFDLKRLGGASSGRGWTSVSIFQRCPYLWQKRYLEDAKPMILIESPARAIGTVVHALLAQHYAGMIDGHPYGELTPDALHDRLVTMANPQFALEGWRVFQAYRLYYKFDRFIPIAVEHDVKDPRTGDSCRYDLIAYLEEPTGEFAAGTYNIEHKTGARFDYAFLEGWQNDGEVIGQNALWQRLHLEKRFGPLQGTIVNLLGKQKVPKFHRTFVAADSWRVESHLQDLRRWEGLINLARSSDVFPRARGNCIHRYGLCDWYAHCAGDDASTKDQPQDLIAALEGSLE